MAAKVRKSIGQLFAWAKHAQGLALIVMSILWIAGVIAVSFLLQPALEWLAPDSDWTQFKSDLVAVGIGIPAGLWIARNVEYWRLGQERRRAFARRQAVLQQLQQELNYNRNQCQQTLEFTARTPPGQFVPRLDLRTQTWEALSASGDLQLIDDPNLLTQIAVAYYVSIGVNAWRRPLRENFASLDFTTANRGQEAAARIVPILIETTTEAVRIFGTTLDRISAALHQWSPT